MLSRSIGSSESLLPSGYGPGQFPTTWRAVPLWRNYLRPERIISLKPVGIEKGEKARSCWEYPKRFTASQHVTDKTSSQRIRHAGRPRVGIPRTLLYYVYFPFWKRFLEDLGAEVVVSEPTTRQLLDDGMREAVADACVPMKVVHGHVMSLADKVDYIFMPRIVCVDGSSVFCPKILGLPDMVRATLPDLPPLIDTRVDVRTGPLAIFKASAKVAKMLGASQARAAWALGRAIKALRRTQSLIRQGITAPRAIDMVAGGRTKPADPLGKTAGRQMTFAVMGYPYLIHDPYIGMNLVERIEAAGARVITPDMMPARVLAKNPRAVKKSLFWMLSNYSLRAAHYLLGDVGRGGDRRPMVDGVIHVTAFACGPDAVVNKMLELKAKEAGVPFMTLVVDEHAGEAGMITRLEAFVDMVRWRKGRGWSRGEGHVPVR